MSKLRPRMPRAAIALLSALVMLVVIGGVATTQIAASANDAVATQSLADPAAQTAPDPASFSDAQLAAQLVLAGINVADVRRQCSNAARGLGGFVLFGSPTARLRSDLRSISSCDFRGVRPWFASDEEGGRVQRLARLLGSLPPAASMGRSMSVAQIEATARQYAQRMRLLGVQLALSPVADLSYRGTYIAQDGRAFSANQRRAAGCVAAWIRGFNAAGVASTAKHWPGHGSARNTHTGAGRTMAWTRLQSHDIYPFRAAFAAGVPTVMVGHLLVPGLTGKLPASQSTRALAELRREAGPDVVIITDSLAMDAVTSALRQSQPAAAVRALGAGADVALVNETDPWSVVRAITRALRTGQLHRDQLVASARRVLAAKARFALTSASSGT